MHNTTECQRKLILLGYLPAIDPDTKKPNDDGVFGTKSLDAYNRYRKVALHKEPAVPPIHLDALNADLFPEEQPAPAPPSSNPITDFFTRLAMNAAISKLKGLPGMNNVLIATSTGVTGVVMIVVGAASLVSLVVPLGPIQGFTPLTPGEAVNSITTGAGLIFLRRAIAKNGTGA